MIWISLAIIVPIIIIQWLFGISAEWWILYGILGVVLWFLESIYTELSEINKQTQNTDKHIDNYFKYYFKKPR
jgi:hypothetical protein|tara:strand:+ start:451 stop:669 length:219 start_codon:yes stop_codon:yes gene_type:complete